MTENKSNIIPEEQEEWRWVKGFEGRYEVSNMGHVRSYVKHGYGIDLSPVPMRILCGGLTSGYIQVDLSKGDRVRHPFRIHVLVAAAFLGDCPDRHQVNHKNWNKTDNRLDNLEYLTSQGNTLHSRPRRRGQCGTRIGSAKLKESDIPVIKSLRAQGFTYKMIGDRFLVSESAIGHIVLGRHWKHVREDGKIVLPTGRTVRGESRAKKPEARVA